MAALYFFAQACVVDVQVYFGGGYALVAEHLLDGAEVGAPFQQGCCERVAQGVRRYFLAYAGGLGEVAHDVENHHACEPPSGADRKSTRLNSSHWS